MSLSRVDTVRFRDRSFYIKRDDLIDPCLSGNKYRKLYTLLNTPSSRYKKIISYGGAQSNAMYSLACLCHAKGWEFHYYTKTLPQVLKDGLEGNLELSLAKGMTVHEVKHEAYTDKINALQAIKEEGTLVVSQGAADSIAQEGIRLLASEIQQWKSDNAIKELCVVLPSGTGTTALYLKEALANEVEVYTSVLVGDEVYQKEQWKKLSQGPYPTVFKTEKKYKFAKPYDEYLQIHEELVDKTGVIFDLIYAPLTWIQMYEYFKDTKDNVLYIHTGGVSGNMTMLERYKHKNKRHR